MTTVEDLLVRLRDPDDLNGCAEAIDWLAARGGTLEQAWDDCERGDWLMWLADRVDVPDAPYIAARKARWLAVLTDAPRLQRSRHDWLEDERRAASAMCQHITGAMLVAVLDADGVAP